MAVNTLGIDVSKHNGMIDWKQVVSSGKVDFAILRSGFGKASPKQIDTQFERNYAECKLYGMPIGVYHYSYALSPEQASLEADFVLEIIEGKTFEYPIYFDIEEKAQANLSKKQCTAIVEAFCTKLEQAGYWAGFYSYDSFYATDIIPGTAEKYANWVASIEHRKPTSCTNYEMWQYSWKGEIPGIVGEVDLNRCYVDYPTFIKKAGKNGYKKKSLYSINVKCNTIKDVSKVQAALSKLGSEFTGEVTLIN